MPIITLTTDFGTQDPFVGVMKGVILSLCPSATLVDLTHSVPPQNVSLGAFLLADSARFFPTGTIHVAVVDPGVGGARRAMALEADGSFCVGPDNGLFSGILSTATRSRAVELTQSRFHLPGVSSTFHGRDVFAPVDAHLALGTSLMELGDAIVSPVMLPPNAAVVTSSNIRGEVLHVDAFGNALTNIREEDFLRWHNLQARRGITIRCGTFITNAIHRTFSDVEAGQPVAYHGSSGVLELALRNGNAAQSCGFQRGTPVLME